MKKVKYFEGDFVSGDNKEFLYTRSFILPGPGVIVPAIALAGLIYVTTCNPFQHSGWWDFMGVAIIGFNVLVGVLLFFALIGLLDEEPGSTRLFVFRHMPEKYRRIPPMSFDNDLLKTPEYQRVLNDYMQGFDIASLSELNRLIRKRIKKDRETLRIRSGVVENEIENIKAYIGE